MKKNILISALFMLGWVNIQTIYGQCGPVFYDGFESGSYTPTWSMGSGLTSGAVTTTSPANGMYRLEGTGGVNTHLTGFSTTIASATPTHISWWIYPSGTASSNYVVLGDASVTATNCISFCYWQGGTNIRFVSGSTAVYNCAPNQWHHVEMRNVNFTTHVFDIYINNTLVQANFPFRSSTQNSLSKIHLYNFSSSVGVWDDITIGNSEPITLSETHTPALCYGAATGSIDLTASSTNPGSLNYAWSNTANTQDVSGLLAGTYSVLVTDALGCTDSITNISITQPNIIVSDTTSTQPTCPGGTNGTASITTSGGTPGYSYLWSNGSTTPNISSLAAGTYQCTVTDTNGCPHINSVVVAEPPAFNASFNTSSPSCFGDGNGSTGIQMSGGTPGYTYLWSTTETTPAISNLSAGWYYCTTTDTNNCSHQDSVYISEPALLNIALSSTHPSTCGGNNGSINATITGGTAGYNYLWSNGATTEDLAGLSQGGYTLELTDTNGCADTVFIALTDPTPTSVTLDIPEDTVCLTNGAFNLTGASVSGGTYSGSGVSGGSFTPSIAGAGSQNITYNYTDANNCVTSAQDIIVVSPCLGLEDEGTENLVRLYPNPATSFIHIELLSAGTPVGITLVDGLGQIMETHPFIQQNTVINIAQYPAGIYYVHIQEGQKVRVEKLIVQ
jgi:hypothetical protein